MGRIKGVVPFSGTFEPQAAGGIDGRIAVEFKSDLINPDVWKALDGNVYVYKGMPVTVWNDGANNGVYVLIADDYTDINNWLCVGSGNIVNAVSNSLNNFGRPVNGEIEIDLDAIVTDLQYTNKFYSGLYAEGQYVYFIGGSSDSNDNYEVFMYKYNWTTGILSRGDNFFTSIDVNDKTTNGTNEDAFHLKFFNVYYSFKKIGNLLYQFNYTRYVRVFDINTLNVVKEIDLLTINDLHVKKGTAPNYDMYFIGISFNEIDKEILGAYVNSDDNNVHIFKSDLDGNIFQDINTGKTSDNDIGRLFLKSGNYFFLAYDSFHIVQYDNNLNEVSTFYGYIPPNMLFPNFLLLELGGNFDYYVFKGYTNEFTQIEQYFGSSTDYFSDGINIVALNDDWNVALSETISYDVYGRRLGNFYLNSIRNWGNLYDIQFLENNLLFTFNGNYPQWSYRNKRAIIIQSLSNVIYQEKNFLHQYGSQVTDIAFNQNNIDIDVLTHRKNITYKGFSILYKEFKKLPFGEIINYTLNSTNYTDTISIIYDYIWISNKDIIFVVKTATNGHFLFVKYDMQKSNILSVYVIDNDYVVPYIYAMGSMYVLYGQKSNNNLDFYYINEYNNIIQQNDVLPLEGILIGVGNTGFYYNDNDIENGNNAFRKLIWFTTQKSYRTDTNGNTWGEEIINLNNVLCGSIEQYSLCVKDGRWTLLNVLCYSHKDKTFDDCSQDVMQYNAGDVVYNGQNKFLIVNGNILKKVDLQGSIEEIEVPLNITQILSFPDIKQCLIYIIMGNNYILVRE